MNDTRRAIGDLVLAGSGFEIGAGLVPSKFAGVTDLTVIDKRSADDFAQHFGSPAPYAISSLQGALATSSGAGDFVTAHHVLEHCADPISVLIAWLPLLRVGGTLFLSIPSAANECECFREVTPIDHLLADFTNEADGTDYDSRQHVPGFLNQWTTQWPEKLWFANDGAQSYARQSLTEQLRTVGHDLHWHTFDMEVFRQVVEVAFYAAGMGMAWVRHDDTGSELFCVARRTAERVGMPPCLAAYIERRRQRFDALDQIGFATISGRPSERMRRT